MDASLSAFLGLVFLFLGFAAVLLMFRYGVIPSTLSATRVKPRSGWC